MCPQGPVTDESWWGNFFLVDRIGYELCFIHSSPPLLPRFLFFRQDFHHTKVIPLQCQQVVALILMPSA